MNIRSAKSVKFEKARATTDDTRSLYHYLGIIRNRRWFLIGVVSACLLTALVASFVFKYEYRAKATIQINPERSDFYTGWHQSGTVAENRTEYLTDLEGLNSNGLARRVITDLQLWDNKEFSPLWKRVLGLTHSESAVIEEFRKRVRVSTVSGSMLVNVQFSASDPELASTVLNALADRFTAEHSESIRQIPGLAADWMSEKIPALRSSLAEAEQRMQAFRVENGLVDVDGSISRLDEMELSEASLTVTQMSLELEQIRAELAQAMSIFEDMSDPAETGERLEGLEMISSDPVIQDMWLRRSTILSQIESLSLKYGPKHPSMVDANTQLASVEGEVAEQIDRIVAAAMKRMDSLGRQLSQSQTQVAGKTQDLLSVQEKRVRLSALEREVTLQRDLVDTFYVNTLKARSLEGFELDSAFVVDAAIPPLQPYRPQRLIILMLVALSSSIFALLFVFVHEHVDDKIRSTRDVATRLRVNLLGILPDFSSVNFAVTPGKSREPACMYQHSKVVAEAANNIRTSLMTHPAKRVSGANVLLVTASQSGDGSTTSAIALAHSFGRLERTLFVDCHLRQSSLPEEGAENDPVVGLDALISGARTIEDSVQRNALGGNFDVLLCAPDTARSTAILSSSHFTQLIDQLREQYDRIILDAAPLQQDSSSVVLGRLADAIVYVIKSHSTRRMAILRGIRRLHAGNGLVAGVMINRIDLNRVVSHRGDYDYASYCGDISYKEKSDLDIVRGTLGEFADRVRTQYREFDAAEKWERASSVFARFTRRTRTAIALMPKLDVAALIQRLTAFKNSVIRKKAVREDMTADDTMDLSTAAASLNTSPKASFDTSSDTSAEAIERQDLSGDHTEMLMPYYLPKDFDLEADGQAASDQPCVRKSVFAES